MSTDRTALDWTRPIQFANGEPLELTEIMDDGRRRVFRPQADCIEASVWDVASDGRAAPNTLADRLNMHVVNRPPTPDATVDEDGWWEMVFVEKEAIQDDCGCGRGECFTFACECRRIAIENISRDTGVCFATEE